MSNTDRMIYGGKCRCCDSIQVWDFGEASDNQEQLLNMYITEKHNNYSGNKYCEECEGMTIHDFLFYGKKSELQNVINKLSSEI